MAAPRLNRDTQKETNVISFKNLTRNQHIAHRDYVAQMNIDETRTMFSETYGGDSFTENEQSICAIDEPLSGFGVKTHSLTDYSTQLKNALISGIQGIKFAVVGFIGHGNVERAILNVRVTTEVLAELSSIYKFAEEDNPLKHLVMKFRGCMVDKYCKNTRFLEGIQRLGDENKDLPIVLVFCGMKHNLTTDQIFWSETGVDKHLVRKLTKDFRKAGMRSINTSCKMPTISVITLTEKAQVITMRTDRDITGVTNTYTILNPDTGFGMWSENCKGLSVNNGGYNNQKAKILWYFPYIKSKSGIPEEFLYMKPEHFVSRNRNWVNWKHVPNVVVREYQNRINMEHQKKDKKEYYY